MAIPQDFLNKLTFAANSLHLGNLSNDQVKSCQRIWENLFDEDKKRDDIYVVIVQGLSLLPNLKTADLDDASFKRGFELLKKLAPDKLLQEDASKLIIKEMVLPVLTSKKKKREYSSHKILIARAFDKTAKSLEYANKIAKTRATKHTDAEIQDMRTKLEKEETVSGSITHGGVQPDQKLTTEIEKKYTLEKVDEMVAKFTDEEFSTDDAEHLMEAVTTSIKNMGDLIRHCRNGIRFMEENRSVRNKREKLLDYQNKIKMLQNGSWKVLNNELLRAIKEFLTEGELLVSPVEFEEMEHTIEAFLKLIESKLETEAFNEDDKAVEEEEEVFQVADASREWEEAARAGKLKEAHSKNREAIDSVGDETLRRELQKLLDTDIQQFYQKAITVCPQPLYEVNGKNKLKCIITDPMNLELEKRNKERDDVRVNKLNAVSLKEEVAQLTSLSNEALKKKMSAIQAKWLDIGRQEEWYYTEAGKLVQRPDEWFYKMQAVYADGSTPPTLWQNTPWESQWMQFWGQVERDEEEWE